MGSIYKRQDSQFYWVSFTDSRGKPRAVSSKSTDYAFAEKLLANIERMEAAKVSLGVTGRGPVSVEQYAETWVSKRKAAGVAYAATEANRLAHALPLLGRLPLTEIQREDLEKMVKHLREKGTTRSRKMAPAPLAARTIRHVYFTFKQMMDDAVIDKLIPANPCTLKTKRGELPRKRDKNPAWRATAVYARTEVEQYLSSAEIPEYRRVLFALQVLGGLRINEATIRRWQDYDPQAQPLGQLRVLSGYDVKRRLEKGTKTDVVREVPVHPVLARILAAWRLSGWEQYQGRKPEDGDLIVPSPVGKVLNSNSTLLRLHEDQTLLGLRKRRQHDARRTFISLARAGGANKDLLRWVTHGPEGDIVDDYTTPTWPSLCEQVAFLKISLRRGAVLPFGKTHYGITTAGGGTGND